MHVYVVDWPLTRLRFLITIGDVPLVAVTATNDVVMETILEKNPSAFSQPLVDPRCPSDEAHWHPREARPQPPSARKAKDLRKDYKRALAQHHKYMTRWKDRQPHISVRREIAEKEADIQKLLDKSVNASQAQSPSAGWGAWVGVGDGRVGWKGCTIQTHDFQMFKITLVVWYYHAYQIQ